MFAGTIGAKMLFLLHPLALTAPIAIPFVLPEHAVEAMSEASMYYSYWHG